MDKNLPEILFGTAHKAEAQRISRLVKSGRLRKLCPRVYTSNLSDDLAVVLRRNLFPVLGGLFPGALVSHRSALEGGPTPGGHIFLTYAYTRKRVLPGITVHLLKGLGPSSTDSPFVNGLFISSQPRALLENLQQSRSADIAAKTSSRTAVEERLDQLCRIKGEDALNGLRDRARAIAHELEFGREYVKLDSLIGAILKTRPSSLLTSATAIARSRGLAYDPARLPILNALLSSLLKHDFPNRPEQTSNTDRIALFAFFESYFSNYIEGTEFGVDEAFDVVFRHRVVANRPQDAHDIVGTFNIANNPIHRSEAPETFAALISQLCACHHTLMEVRPAASPGQFKTESNRAGQTEFVAPELVRGTLHQGYEMCQALEPGFARAVFLMFLILEVHPFTDGNGRVARLMMNAELSHAQQCRVVIPTVFRDDYLAALRALSRGVNPAPLLKTMEFAQQFSALIPLASYREANEMLHKSNAFMESDEARLVIPG